MTNEFIVWDKKLEYFNDILIAPIDLSIDIDGILKHSDRVDVFNYIGIKDINNKKIYADSSIVKFEYEGFDRYFDSVGFFTFNKDTLQYEIETIIDNNDSHMCSRLSVTKVKNIKIIDTIQQNKRGLIK